MAAAKIAASTGVSSPRNGRSAGLGSVCPIASKYSEQFQRQYDGGCDHGPFDHDVIAPVSWKRRVGTAHRAISVFNSPVTGSLKSLRVTPIAESSLRMRSDTAKSFRARAEFRAAIRFSTSR